MPASSSARVQEARDRIAFRLRGIRADAGLTGQQPAERTGWQGSKVSRLQSGRSQPSDEDIRAWCRACGAEDEAADLIASARQAQQMYTEWRRVQGRGLKGVQQARTPLYERTKVMRVYSSSVIPGMLQTRAYAAALLSEISRFNRTPDDSAAAAEARVERSRVIRRAGRLFPILIEESALRRQVGSIATMAEQLGYLLQVAALPTVTLGIVPSRAMPMWPLETFTIFDEEQVGVELLTAAITITTPSEIAQYLAAHEELSAGAAHGPAALRLIARAVSEFA
ncbi:MULTISPECIES: helix-turn-helix transcriptional regulator [unclassified Streptomyces]|uniref:helix-turn-helix domain-containing protein n=1 Tax=unclassified Streptomyces TaxID=2593676 RepID=UPI000823F0D9|nr:MULTISPECIES: helix-turn-helix transcriptional regulator [unclassified Streptomyces]MYT96428.1 helix-turn-helix domain-containing protein [Streptomyces sp. SID8350]SCK44346.1 Helix-turn-helix domain-containing protein [Streptomyces sp. AmelKG-D3]